MLCKSDKPSIFFFSYAPVIVELPVIGIHLLTSLDGGYCHQGYWNWGGDIAGTAGSRTGFQCEE